MTDTVQFFRPLKNVSNAAVGAAHYKFRALPELSDKIAAQQLALAGHCYWHPELPANKVILWEPSHSMANSLMEDAGAEITSELAMLMEERAAWRACHRAHLN